MAIFPNLVLEDLVQVNDKTRLDGTKSFISKDEAPITLVEIDPGDGTFRDVTGSSSRDYYLDWEYSTDGDQTVQIRITTDGAPTLVSKTLTIITAANDNLLSSDQDLTAIEEEVLKYVPNGRNSFLNVHRKALNIILAELDERGITNTDGSRITKDQLVEVEDFNKWSSYLVLWMIYQDLSNSTDDKFDQKSMLYKDRMNFHRERSFHRIDINGDGTVEVGEYQDVRSVKLRRV